MIIKAGRKPQRSSPKPIADPISKKVWKTDIFFISPPFNSIFEFSKHTLIGNDQKRDHVDKS